MGWSINPIETLKNAKDHVVEGAKEFKDNLVTAGKALADKAVQVPGQATQFAQHVARDPGDAARDAGRAVLRESVEGADKLLPDGAVHFALGAAEVGIDGGAWLARTAGGNNRYAQYLGTLSEVDLQAFTRTDGLKAPWTSLYSVWAFEERPQWLGEWNAAGDTVTITDPRFTGDLAGREQQEAVRQEFFKQHPNPKVGDTLTAHWTYTGQGTSESGQAYHSTVGANGEMQGSGGAYTALESYLGSYDTQVTCTGVDPKTGEVQLKFTVTNTSHWQSGTRVPKTAQESLGLGEYLIPDSKRDQGLGIGGDFKQNFVWNESVKPAAVGDRNAAPAEVQTGTTEYYRQRHNDFMRRNPGMTPPDYYLNYGDKYAHRFAALTDRDLSSEGLAWRDRTLKSLQEAIEERRRTDPEGFAELERDPEKFKAFAYATHPDAYVNSGLFDLSVQDLTAIAMTPDIGDVLSADGLKGWVDTAIKLRPDDVVDIGRATVHQVLDHLPGR